MMCDPCHNHWDAIVKMETFDRDASAILKVFDHFLDFYTFNPNSHHYN